MNKLMGFYELKDSKLPTVPWREYKGESLDDSILWTVRTAVYRGMDLNLPRLVGANALDAEKFAKGIVEKYGDNGMAIYYPYFLAEKSGTLNISSDRIVIEAVKEDLWNLVTDGYRDVTIIIEDNNTTFVGDDTFVSEEEIGELKNYSATVKLMFRDDLLEGNSVQLEWSYAYQSDVNKNRVGERYLVFYEVRTV